MKNNKFSSLKVLYFVLALLITLPTLTGCKKDGCTDPNATNYDSKADNDDGSCIVPGCIDPTANNFDASADVDNGSCVYSGCTDANASNFDANADVDDGSCVLPRTEMLGIYSVTETCSSGTWSYSLTVVESTVSTDAIILQNLGGFDPPLNVKATVAVESGTISINDTQNGATFSGTGTLNGNTLIINYAASAAGFSDDCTATGIKQ